MRVLLVDDDQLMTRMYERKFQFEGHDIVVVDNGRSGLELLEDDKSFDVILLDVMMPEMNGFEFLEAKQKMENAKDIPVIMLTNLVGSEDDEKKGINLGAKEYLVKSRLQPNDIVEAAKKYV
ncbi:TPA: hypothetical protein DDW69_01645 [candidate division CPR2 bacterium]|uniref:Two component transcriptional regulator, two-component system, OmpR family, phosphate regulon response regulator PhoB n=1 Tax=candidate division CPR2 bacterium GW2011_GWC1_41_48 TaxID=1618344 RepID=A0A0G0WCF2_UNCC2|nr:MAG: DNA-binding response regulator [candidate division CPR2 bacterium GW2011_GWC2_39_35]KKR29442.1 MAG: DNA-binding response regulator [candidate division CPR2 bacterium GW2011_GWD2_39_7]KKR29613.1 MAG: DNA-binding response regulator [candidate division CPR2 bacterium GW2011_GWD1_39_7]KKS09727.1 MAG: two component transcriptional regulator, two-component system, OmpR family, phosphate regulon response regulator PhoB [candidate division CPR2 bacterium GW2011_GWC1_41_48]OGB56500.1 MAG: hypoth